MDIELDLVFSPMWVVLISRGYGRHNAKISVFKSINWHSISIGNYIFSHPSIGLMSFFLCIDISVPQKRWVKNTRNKDNTHTHTQHIETTTRYEIKIIPLASYHRAMMSSEKKYINSVWLKRKSVLSLTVFFFFISFSRVYRLYRTSFSILIHLDHYHYY